MTLRSPTIVRYNAVDASIGLGAAERKGRVQRMKIWFLLVVLGL